MIPKKVLIDAGKHYLEKQKLSAGLSERDLMKLAVKTLGLEEFASSFGQKIIEYAIAKPEDTMLADLIGWICRPDGFRVASPGWRLCFCCCGAFGVALGVMVANLTSTKKGYEKH
jgi:glutamate formiminotransferase/formiminotetrahydrofolate cyclodeaminase